MSLTFGRYRGKRLQEVPIDYLAWLASPHYTFKGLAEAIIECKCYKCKSFKYNSGATTEEECEEVLRRSIIEDGVVPMCICGSSEAWWNTYARHSDWVMNARRELSNRRICAICLKTLVAIGHGRLNGKDHSDWKERTMHKECWWQSACAMNPKRGGEHP